MWRWRYRGVNGLDNWVLQIMWTGAKYAVTDDSGVIGAYYHYIQNSWFGTPTGGPAFCSDSSHAQCAGTYDAIPAAVGWRFSPKWDLNFGMMFNQVHGGLGFGSCTIPRWGCACAFDCSGKQGLGALPAQTAGARSYCSSLLLQFAPIAMALDSFNYGLLVSARS